MTEHHSVVEYLSGPEELTRKEPVWEYWIIDPVSQTVEVSTLDETTGRVQRTTMHERGRVCSNILGGLAEPTRTFFE